VKRPSRELSLRQCYEALGLEEGVGLEELKSAYRRRAFELHPDLHPDNPHAGRDFQVVNEAYVILAKILPPRQNRPEEKAPGGADAASTRQERARENSRENPADAASARPEADEAAGEHHEETRRDRGAAERTRRAAHAEYAKEDLLRDLLDDPFARRVFEDIYAQMQDARDSSPPPPQSNPGEHNASQAHAETVWGKEHLNLDFSRGIGNAVKTWMRRQLDEEQTFHLPPSVLRPGARIRLQIRRASIWSLLKRFTARIRLQSRRGMSDELSAVEIKLPWDYMEGKPVRLRGMGIHIGRWQGDLYLTLVAKQ